MRVCEDNEKVTMLNEYKEDAGDKIGQDRGG